MEDQDINKISEHLESFTNPENDALQTRSSSMRQNRCIHARQVDAEEKKKLIMKDASH